MKTTVKFMSMAVLAVMLNACGSDKKSDTDTSDEKLVEEQPIEMEEQHDAQEMDSDTEAMPAAKMKIGEGALRFNNETAAAVWEAYNNVRQALIASDAAKAKTAGANLAMIFDETNAGLKEKAEAIATTQDLEKQRLGFSEFSKAVASYFKGTLRAGTLYKQHCPMAFSGSGADWLSDESTIKNPYFGNKMLNCGSVTATITH